MRLALTALVAIKHVSRRHKPQRAGVGGNPRKDQGLTLAPSKSATARGGEVAEDAGGRAASNSTRLIPPACLANRPIKGAACASDAWQRHRPALRHQRRTELGACFLDGDGQDINRVCAAPSFASPARRV